ncbi:MAG: ABC transporter substrate-binding protein [Parachlamydiaceae bacterium]|nr:ABC transporter substrate-binding protein [Parachlamydiaceae bacterium]
MNALKNLCITFLFFLSSCSNQENYKIPIAILTPVTHPSLEQIEKGFKETMEAESPGKYSFTTYNAQGNKTLMRGEVEEIAQKGYSLVFTIGTSSSQMTKEVFSKKALQTPIVFAAVNDPVGFHIVSSEQTPGGSITGVKELLNFNKELELVLNFKPTIKSVLLVYNSMEPGLTKDHEVVKSILKDKRIELITVEIFQTNEMMHKISPFIEKSDAVLVLKDNTVVGGLDVLIKLCNQQHIPLITSDLDSPGRGAAFGYGVYEIDFGIEAAKKALLILEQRISAGNIPVTPVSQFTFMVNRNAAEAQGIDSALLEKEAFE